jgi:Lactonase, 7-bladed beta-propeller
MRIRRFAAASGLLASIAIGGALASPAGASIGHPNHDGHAVFVSTDDTTGNRVVAYDRAGDGTLTQAGSYLTHGLGGSLTGAVVDRTASQGALTYDAAHGLLLAVNAGSNTVSSFSVHGDHLRLEQVVPSGGSFPVSVAVHGNLVEVLNARAGGTVQGYVELGGHLLPLPGRRPLGLDPTPTPEFTHTPGQVTFSPDGSKVLVTTKANTNAVDVFSVGWFGLLSPSPVVTTFAGDVPFALTFDRAGHAVIALAGSSSVATAALQPDGHLVPITTQGTAQAATCWIVRSGDVVYASNAGSATLTGLAVGQHGALTILGNTHTDGGTVDSAVTPDGHFLYVQGGAAGVVDAFRIGSGGALTALGSSPVPDAIGGEGIVAT